MPGRLRLELNEAQRAELEDLRDHAQRPYLRERAAALLKVAEGWSAWKTARQGLLKPRYKETVCEWVRRYQKLVQTYPQALQIALAEDNWPVHFHPDLLAALQPQDFPFGVHTPGNWPQTPSPQAKRLNLPIRILFLPTYASWTNPIEKLWRYLKQELLHLHRFGDDWVGLKQAVVKFLDELVAGSQDLLTYVGLRDPTKLYRALFMPDACQNVAVFNF